MKNFLWFLFLFLMIITSCSTLQKEKVISNLKNNKEEIIYLKKNNLEVWINPANLSVTARNLLLSDTVHLISYPVIKEKVYNFDKSKNEINYSKLNLQCKFIIENNCFSISFDSGIPQNFTWPNLKMEKEKTNLILPLYEGFHIPLNDVIWCDFLSTGQWNIEEMYMPFWGIEYNDSIVTYILDNPFYNTIKYSNRKESFEMNMIHSYPKIKDPKGFLKYQIYIDSNQSLIKPAIHFREKLISEKNIVTLEEKIKKAPLIKKIIGAPHAYLWNSAPLTVKDFKQNSWIPFISKLFILADSGDRNIGYWIKHKYLKDFWEDAKKIKKSKRIGVWQKKWLCSLLSKMLLDPNFYKTQILQASDIPLKFKKIYNNEKASEYEIFQINSYLLLLEFGEYFHDPKTWGNGISTKMIDALVDAGIRNGVLCYDNDRWTNSNIRPHIAEYARAKGFVFGPYDSYHSLQDPDNQAWSTVVFNKEVFEKGRILDENGIPVKGFLGIGGMLNPIYGRPFIENRITENFKNSPYSYYFVDCDAFGEFYTNYDPEWLTCKSRDAEARISRIKWIYETYKVPVGSEGGSYLFAKELSIAEGISLPVIGFYDAEMEKNKSSIYYIGRHYDTNPVYLKDNKVHIFAKPAYRLPLYQTVFHDSIVSTSHYSSPSIKFTNIREDMALMEILYQIAPMYHWDLDNFEETNSMIIDHIKTFNKTHSISYKYPLSEFKYLSADHMVQKTVFGDLEMIGNFSKKEFEFKNIKIPNKSILINFKKTGESFIYQCSEKLKDPLKKYSVNELIKNLSSENEDIQVTSIRILAFKGKEAIDAIPYLLKKASHTNEEVREAVAFALSNIRFKPDAAIPVLKKMLSDLEWKVQLMAIYAISSYKSNAKSAVNDLISFLDNPEWQLQNAAAFCLGEMGKTAAKSLPYLIKLYNSNSPEFVLRLTVEEAIAKINPLMQ